MNKIIKILPSETWDVIVSPYKRDWQGIIHHHSVIELATNQGELIEDMHINGKRAGYPPFKYGMGYHFLVNRSGDIEVGIRWPRQIHGAHCPGFNQTHIGVCWAGNLMIQNLTDEQYDSGVQLLYYIGERMMSLHKDHKATLCPGNNFSLVDIRDRLLVNKYEEKIRSVQRWPLFTKH